MTDETTTPPAGDNAYREAANELDTILEKIDRRGATRDATRDDSHYVPVMLGPGKSYRLHVRALRFAAIALNEKQRRIDAVNRALNTQGPTDLNTQQVKRIAQLVTDITSGDTDALGSIDAIPHDIRPEALAAVLRAGLASVVGTSAVNPIDATVETEELVGGPAGYLTRGTRTVLFPEIDDALKAIADHLDTYRDGSGKRYPYACILPSMNTTGHERGTEVPAPAWISARALTEILRTWPHGKQPARLAEHDILGDLIPDAELPAFARRIQEQLHEAQRELKMHHPSPWQEQLELDVDTLENPVQHAVATVLHNGWQELSRFALVRAITVAALDASADVVRRELKRPRVTPLVVLDRTELNAEQVVEVVDRYRRTMADAAADELRILARTDAAGR